jgi:hypothetical protein
MDAVFKACKKRKEQRREKRAVETIEKTEGRG